MLLSLHANEKFPVADTEQALDAILNGTAVITAPDLPVETSELVLHNFIEDVAQAVHTPETIAGRYGFRDAAAMVAWIGEHPKIRQRIKIHRSVWESDDHVEARIKKLAAHSILESLPTTSSLMLDTSVSPNVRVDAMRAHARLAGMDQAGPAGGGSGPVGAGFQVNFHFSDGSKQAITTVGISKPPPVIDGEAS